MPDWNTDAQFAAVIDERFLGTNSQIDSFLDSGTKGKFLVIASKGMGKTLLLRHKRKQLEEDHKDYFLIPRNGTADYVRLPSSPTKGLLIQMEEHAFWQDLWTISIAVSTLLNFPHSLTESERETVKAEVSRAELPSAISLELIAALTSKHRIYRSPSGVLDILLQSDIKAVAKARGKGAQIITDLFSTYINSGCAIFIDSFDQAISTAYPDNLAIWCNGQTGLLKASWELSRHNRHAKIFVTIRQEAYSHFRDPEKNNIKGSALLIEYTDDDLRRIFERAVSHYEQLDSIEEFLGVEQIYNGYLRLREDVFAYVCRHTIGVPRWLMVIGEAMSNARHDRGVITSKDQIKKQQKLISVIVNQKSAELGRDYLVDEMGAFYKGDTPDQFVDCFLANIGSTVLSISALGRITEKLLNSGWSGTEHPFCLLYNLGLLGHVAIGADGVKHHQHFARPYQFDWSYDCILPKGNQMHYLLHPALHNLVQSKNPVFRFNHVRIGNKLPWGKRQEEQVKKETIRIFISYAHADNTAVTEIATIIEDHLSAKSILHDIWFDKWKMKAGKWVQDQMAAGLTESGYLILVASKASLVSNAVAIEWKSKFSEKISAGDDTVFPFLLPDAEYEDLPVYLKNIYSYRYDGARDVVVRLVEDMLYWHDSAP